MRRVRKVCDLHGVIHVVNTGSSMRGTQHPFERKNWSRCGYAIGDFRPYVWFAREAPTTCLGCLAEASPTTPEE
jgi:hypothetical protein